MSTTTRDRGHRRSLGAALLLLAAACAPGGPQGTAGAGASTRAAPEAGRAPAAKGEFTPAAAAAPAYGAEVGRCAAGGVPAAVLHELTVASKRAGRQPPVMDGTMCAVAEAFLRWDDAAGPPRPQVLAFVSQWFGLPSPIAPPAMAVIESEDTRLLTERLVEAVGNAVMNAERPRIGVVTRYARRNATRVVAVVADAPVEIKPPFPRRLEAGQKATLSGRVLGGLKSPRVQVSDPVGKLTTSEKTEGDTFQAEVACGTKPGRMYVEIRAEDAGGPGSVASFPVGCGVDLPGAIALAPEPWPMDPPAGEKKIFEQVNAERTAAGLPALKWDDAVAGVARAISEELAAGAGSSGSDVGERLKREGIATHLILQSAGADRSFDRVHERLVSSPSNRANLMNPDVTTAGIGAVVKNGPDGKPVVYVAEVFTKELAAADPAKVRRELKAAVAQKRRDARMTPLREDPALDEIAQRYAEALATTGGSLPKEKQTELTAPLSKTMRTLSILSGAKPEPLDFAEEPQVTAVAKVVGVGVAQGRHAVLGRNAAYVVIMVGTPRSEPADAKPAATGSRKAPPARKP